MKKSVTIEIDEEIFNSLNQRAKKQFFSLKEMIEDILRRSVISSKKKISAYKKLDDPLVDIFSKNKYKKRKR